MEAKIKRAISEIENSHQIKVLYACETGSRAWGFPSPDSDYDVRIIYIHPRDWYLSLSEKKDSLEYMLENGDLDITGWDVRKCLRLLWKSNGALLERIQSPIRYYEETGIVSVLQDAADHCFSPIATMHHYLGMAKKSFADVEGENEVKLKKLFYALRATLACKWIVEMDSIPPIVFITMVNELTFDVALKQKIKELIELKSGKSEKYMHPAEIDLNVFIRNQINDCDNIAPALRGRKLKDFDLDPVFFKILDKFGT